MKPGDRIRTFNGFTGVLLGRYPPSWRTRFFETAWRVRRDDLDPVLFPSLYYDESELSLVMEEPQEAADV